MMKIKASAGRGKGSDLRDGVNILELRAETQIDREWLAFLYSCSTGGGWLRMGKRFQKFRSEIQRRHPER